MVDVDSHGAATRCCRGGAVDCAAAAMRPVAGAQALRPARRTASFRDKSDRSGS